MGGIGLDCTDSCLGIKHGSLGCVCIYSSWSSSCGLGMRSSKYWSLPSHGTKVFSYALPLGLEDNNPNG